MVHQVVWAPDHLVQKPTCLCFLKFLEPCHRRSVPEVVTEQPTVQLEFVVISHDGCEPGIEADPNASQPCGLLIDSMKILTYIRPPKVSKGRYE